MARVPAVDWFGLVVLLAGVFLVWGWSPSLAADTLETVKERGTLIVGVKGDDEPYGFRDPNGNLIGIEPDLARDIADRIGVKLELVAVNAANRLQMLEQGRIDMVIATMGDNEKRRRQAGIVEPRYYASGVNVIAPKEMKLTDWNGLKGKAVCAKEGHYFNKDMAQHHGAKPSAFKAKRDALLALKGNTCAAYMDDDTSLTVILRDSGEWGDYEMPLPTVDEIPWAIAVPLKEEKAPLGLLVSDAIADWHRSGKLITIVKKWGLDPIPYLSRMNAIWSEKEGDTYLCQRSATGEILPEKCR